MKKKENVIFNQEKTQLMEMDPEMTEMIDLKDRDMLKQLKESMNRKKK